MHQCTYSHPHHAELGSELDEAGIACWQVAHKDTDFPDDLIACPLGKKQLGQPILLSVVAPDEVKDGSTFSKQEKAHKKHMQSKPLSPQGRSLKRGRRSNTSVMKPLAPSSVKLRLKVVLQFVGFCAYWMEGEASMEHIMKPTNVAKYLGYLQAKGSAISSILTYASNLAQSMWFVVSKFCPTAANWTDNFIDATFEWYTNLIGKLSAINKANISRKLIGVSLWEIMEKSRAEWRAFKQLFQVGAYRTTAHLWPVVGGSEGQPSLVIGGRVAAP